MTKATGAGKAKSKQQQRVQDQQVRESTEFLDCKLTDAELLEHGRNMARLERDITEVESQKAEAAKGFTAKIEGLKQRRAELARKIEVGVEQRAVDSRWIYDFKAGTKTLFRKDTGAQIRSEEISVNERQMMLPGTEEKPKEEKPKADSPGHEVPPVQPEGEGATAAIDESGDAHNLAGDSIVRTWWNSLGKKEKREALGVEESGATAGLLALPWSKLPTADRITIRTAHRKLSESGATTETQLS